MDQYPRTEFINECGLNCRFSLVIFFFILVLSLPSIGLSQEDSGYVKIVTDLQPLLITVADNPYKIWFMKANDSLKLRRGEQEINIINPFIRDVKTFCNIRKNETTITYFKSPESYPYHPESSYERILGRLGNYNAKIVSDSGVKIFLGDSLVGVGVAKIKLAAGLYEFNVQHLKFGAKSVSMQLDKDTFAIIYSFLKPNRTVSYILAAIPGASQFYKGQYIKAGSIVLLTTAALATTYLFDKKFREFKDKYYTAKTDYDYATDPYLAFKLGNHAQSLADDTQLYKSRRNLAVYFIAAVYLLNLMDAFLTDPPGFYRDATWHILSQESTSSVNDVNLTLSFSF